MDFVLKKNSFKANDWGTPWLINIDMLGLSTFSTLASITLHSAFIAFKTFSSVPRIRLSSWTQGMICFSRLLVRIEGSRIEVLQFQDPKSPKI
jgi:hypothetical protein